MPIDSDLRAAGQRAAIQPVPPAPPIASIEAGAVKRTSRRRVLVSGATMVMLAALAFPLALTMRGTTTVQTVAAGTGQAAAAAQVPPAQAAPTQADPEEPESVDPAPVQSDEGLRIQLRSGNDISVAIRVVSGDAAGPAARAAEAAATETLDIDGMTVWIAGNGNPRTVSALVEPDEFVEVTGNAEQLDMLIQVLRDGGLADHGANQGLHGFNLFDDGEFSIDIDGLDIEGRDLEELLNGLDRGFGGFNDFGDFEEFFGPDGFNLDGDIDGFSFDFDKFDVDDFDFDDFDFDGNFSLDGDFGDLEQFFGPDGFDFDSEFFGQNFDGCIVIDHTESGADAPFHLELPSGCGSAD